MSQIKVRNVEFFELNYLGYYRVLNSPNINKNIGKIQGNYK